MPTLCELSGTEAPADLDGVSFAPTLLGNSKNQEQRNYLYWEFHERGGKQAVRMGNWKGIRLNVKRILIMLSSFMIFLRILVKRITSLPSIPKLSVKLRLR